ncbi:MAG: hypothetical protein QOI26_2086, partial [Pseudonocardiales bacterium]|nr:hypothetical protein [Pseudonocardiales bacterium]
GAALRRAGDVSAAAASKVTPGRGAKAAAAKAGSAQATPAKAATTKATPAKAATTKTVASEPATATKTGPAKAAANSAPAAKRAPAAKKAPAKKSPAKKSPAKTAPPADRAPAEKGSPAKKVPATKAVTSKAAAKRIPAKNAPPVKKTPVKKTPAKKSPAKAAPAKATPSSEPATTTAVSSDGIGLSATELAEIRGRLQDELAEMQVEYDRSITELNDLRQYQADGAGDDQVDVGSKTFEREQEQSIAANRLLLLTQIQHAIERIDSGTYGICEDCGRPIPKARLKALPMATLDAECKARAERR